MEGIDIYYKRDTRVRPYIVRPYNIFPLWIDKLACDETPRNTINDVTQNLQALTNHHMDYTCPGARNPFRCILLLIKNITSLIARVKFLITIYCDHVFQIRDITIVIINNKNEISFNCYWLICNNLIK